MDAQGGHGKLVISMTITAPGNIRWKNSVNCGTVSPHTPAGFL